MISVEFDERLNEANFLITARLAGIWKSFGESDFPIDSGVSFRNEFIKISLNFFNALHNPVHGDEWFTTNIPLLEKLTPQQIMRVIGNLHFYIATWNVCERGIAVKDYRKTLDWIWNTYDFPSAAAVEWSEVATRNGDYVKSMSSPELGVPEGRRKLYCEIAAILSADPRDEKNMGGWCGMGIILGFSYEYNDVAHTQWCSQVFDYANRRCESEIQQRDGWPRLAADSLAPIPAREQLMIRQHQEETIAASKMQLADICENCHIKPQFAKTYRVLRRDLRKTLEKLRARLSQPNPQVSDAYLIAFLRSTDAIISYKLNLMAQHFNERWGEPIENWAGKEGSWFDRLGW